MAETESHGKAWPLADADLNNSVRIIASVDSTRFEKIACQILDLVQQARNYNQLKKGANEGTFTSAPSY